LPCGHSRDISLAPAMSQVYLDQMTQAAKTLPCSECRTTKTSGESLGSRSLNLR